MGNLANSAHHLGEPRRVHHLEGKLTCLLLLEGPYQDLLLVQPDHFLCLKLDERTGGYDGCNADVFDFTSLLPPPVDDLAIEWEVFQVVVRGGTVCEGPEGARISDPDFYPKVRIGLSTPEAELLVWV